MNENKQNIMPVLKKDWENTGSSYNSTYTKHKNNVASNKLDQVIRQKYGEYILVNHMVDSAEIDNSTNLLLSLYEKTHQINSGTYKRALEASNRVNEEIFDSLKEIWAKQSNDK